MSRNVPPRDEEHRRGDIAGGRWEMVGGGGEDHRQPEQRHRHPAHDEEQQHAGALRELRHRVRAREVAHDVGHLAVAQPNVLRVRVR